MSGYFPVTIRDRSVPPPDPHFELFFNLTPPTLPARQPGEDERVYQRRLKGWAEEESGKRARPRFRREQLRRVAA